MRYKREMVIYSSVVGQFTVNCSDKSYSDTTAYGSWI